MSLLFCRFLTRLLLVHGYLADYRLQRLIKYSFYKNITFAFVFLFYQPFNGVSGQVTPPEMQVCSVEWNSSTSSRHCH